MSKTYRPYAPMQGDLFPGSPADWLPKDHLAFFILEVVENLDLSAIHAYYEREERGQPPYDPKMMVGLLLFGYCTGMRSSRLIERKTWEDVATRMLAGGNHPDHTRISEFRRIHLKALSGLFIESLKLCQAAGLVRLGHVALDGTKVKANASKHKAMSYERMQKAERELESQVKAMLREATQADAVEDRRYGKTKRGDEMPEELRDPARRLARIREARRQLEAEALAQKQGRDNDDEPKSGGSASLPSHQVPCTDDGTPMPKAQRNFTDADSRIMKGNGEFVQAYNCQAAVDEFSQVIVAEAVTNQPPDSEHFVPMIEQVIANTGDAPETLTADNGYFAEANLVRAAELGVDAYIAAGRTKRGEPPPRARGRPKARMTPKQWMARRLATKDGAAIYARRKATVEPVFGQIKSARGIRMFLLRGLAKARGEWALICATHNLLKVHRLAYGA